MNNLSIFQSFAKGTPKSVSFGSNCVIYTRVSTSEQEKGYSLDIQLKENTEFAQKRNLLVLGTFGGVYESAKNDERKEFNRMLKFIKQSREKITYIIVHLIDRFSRSGPNALYIKEELKKVGVYLLSVRFPTDGTTIDGEFNQNLQILLAHKENQDRRQRCMAGTREALLRGEWPTMPPFGYNIVYQSGKRSIVVNEKGKLLRKAFLWKAEGCYTNEQVRERLAEIGLKLSHQRLSELFRNPFYCGMIVHNMLDGEVVQGKQEKLVSQDVFIKVNGLLNQNAHGYKINEENDDLPLKHFLRCGHCGAFMRGYIVKKKKILYYKCGVKGCKNNKNAQSLYDVFIGILKPFSADFEPEFRGLFSQQVSATYNKLNDGREDESLSQHKQIEELQSKINRLEERFINEEISSELFQKYTEKYRVEKLELEKNLHNVPKGVSNLEDCIEKAMNLSSKLASEWTSAGYAYKQKIQNIIFPEGITYNKRNDECRTPRINWVFALIARLRQDFINEKIGIPELNLSYADLVVSTGIEPVSKV